MVLPAIPVEFCGWEIGRLKPDTSKFRRSRHRDFLTHFTTRRMVKLMFRTVPATTMLPVATPFLIIDGYNLMHAAGIARRSYGPGVLSDCRARLSRRLIAALSREVLERTTVVYDAFESPSNDSRLHDHGELTVLFAPRGTDADSQIERLLRRHSAPRQVIVVSSDKRLKKAARRRKAGCVDSDDFIAAIEAEESNGHRATAGGKTVPTGKSTMRDGHTVPQTELDRWLDSFQSTTASQRLSDTGFDTHYLKQICDDLKRGKLG